MPDATPEAVIRKVLTETRRIALVGASAKPDRPSHGVMRFLLGKGFAVMPVNPGLAGQSILGQTVVARLADVPGPLEMVDIFRNSEAAGPVMDEAVALGAKTLWLQLGVVNEPAAARARAAGLVVIQDRCPAIEWRLLGLP
ncbi:MAG: CoA-binding protein [Alphaproteobacteria bacterium]|nr:CoA-binding protein [Alphaproteobacteria bacterium]